uniref:Transposase n=1 Tax=Ascaris lumbricoides TaxID=6252 RepID=A0A0M3IB12_ASCLU
MLNLAFAFAQKELTKLHITVDDTLRTYTGPRVPVCNAVALYLKNHFSLKPCFSIYRRLCGIQIIDDYEGERKDRQNFKSTLRALKEKMLKMEQRPDFDDYEGERKDRQNFKSTLRALKEKMLKMEQRPDFGELHFSMSCTVYQRKHDTFRINHVETDF